jgi:NTP pyrophosphatase (non-canonical NTP hydrolase)
MEKDLLKMDELYNGDIVKSTVTGIVYLVGGSENEVVLKNLSNFGEPDKIYPYKLSYLYNWWNTTFFELVDINFETYDDEYFKDSFNRLMWKCHNQAVDAGWWDNPDYNTAEKLMLIVSEIAEAMEGDRKVLKDDKLPHREMIEVELADAVIRICDLAGKKGFDLGGAIVEKLEYNRTREDHKRENREKVGGKKY